MLPQLAVYTTCIPLIHCLLGDYMSPTTYSGNQKQLLTIYWTCLKTKGPIRIYPSNSINPDGPGQFPLEELIFCCQLPRWFQCRILTFHSHPVVEIRGHVDIETKNIQEHHQKKQINLPTLGRKLRTNPIRVTSWWLIWKRAPSIQYILLHTSKSGS